MLSMYHEEGIELPMSLRAEIRLYTCASYDQAQDDC